MEAAQLTSVMQDAIYTVLIMSAPMLVTGLLIGVIISIFQATTQINDQTLSFVPKLIGIFIALLVFGGWMVTTMSDFFVRMFEQSIRLIQ